MNSNAPSSTFIYGAFAGTRTAEKIYELEQLKELSTSEWQEIKAAHKLIFQVTQSFDKFLVFSWTDLQESEEKLLLAIEADQANSGVFVTEFQYRLLNFSVGLKLYHESIVAELNRNCTDDQKERVHTAFSGLYDENFGYRLIYNMRNAYLHGVRDLVQLRSTRRLRKNAQDGSEDTISNFEVQLNKVTFLASRANASVRNEVREMTEIPDLRILCSDAYSGVNTLHPEIIETIYPDAFAAADLIWSYMQEANQRLHFMKLDPKVKNKSWEHITLDKAEFDFIVEHGKKNNAG